MTPEAPDWLSLLRRATDRFAEVIDRAAPDDLDLSATFCPSWTLADLTVHLGGIHRWAAHAVVEGHPDFRPSVPDPSHPDLADWYRGCAAHLLAVLTTTPADAPAWTLDVRDPTAGFWRRRQLHETVLHTWDAEDALGDARPIDPWVAWDGVLEVADILGPRQVRLGRTQPLPVAVRLVATDVHGDITLGDITLADEDRGEGDGDPLVVRDRAEVLLRLMWHRVTPGVDPVAVEPGAALLLSAAVTP